MAAGLWGYLSKRDYKSTLNLLVKEAGDADTNGAVCGALYGSKVGYSNLPKDWLVHMPNKSWLDAKVIKLLKLMKLI